MNRLYLVDVLIAVIIARYTEGLTCLTAILRFTFYLVGPLGLTPAIVLVAERLLCHQTAARFWNRNPSWATAVDTWTVAVVART